MTPQRAKKVMSDSPGLVDFAIGLVIFVLNLPDGQGKLGNSNYRRVKSILLIKKGLRLVEMTCGLVHSKLQLARMAGCKTDFFAPCFPK